MPGWAGQRAGATDRADDPAPARGRHGATRADIGHTVGATALQPRIADPDEVTDTGARRARSAFRLADEPDQPAGRPRTRTPRSRR